VLVDRFDPGRQPAGRAPAPGRLGLVQAFVNSFWDLDAHGAEVWADPAAYGAWLHERGLAPCDAAGTDDLARALELREALRTLARANHDGAAAPEADAVLDRIAVEVGPGAGLTPRFAGGPPRLDAAGHGPDAALGLVLGVVFAARADGTWARLKACPGPHCGWAFYDRSRNRSSQWCSMRICGNRTKGARHRARGAAR
jgi:predicted RNA-binding Zn ribbon-like protein